jgi:hypothetical protein
MPGGQAWHDTEGIDMAEAPVLTSLVFYIDEDSIDEPMVRSMFAVVSAMGSIRQWSIGPPVFLNELEQRPSLPPLRTVGGLLNLHSAYPRERTRLSIAEDATELEDASAVIAELSRFSRETGVRIGVMYGGEDIGAIEDGVPDRAISEGLLGEWRHGLEKRRAAM